MKDYWFYQGKVVTSITDFKNSDTIIGFVYRINNLVNEKIYIGKKNFYSNRKVNLGKKALPADKRLKTYKRVIKESDWLTYYGSCKELIEDLKLHQKQNFRREILEVACSVKQLTYLEIKHQFTYGVLEIPSYNDNILGKFYRKDLIECEQSLLG